MVLLLKSELAVAFSFRVDCPVTELFVELVARVGMTMQSLLLPLLPLLLLDLSAPVPASCCVETNFTGSLDVCGGFGGSTLPSTSELPPA
jgi:hypothetical protein